MFSEELLQLPLPQPPACPSVPLVNVMVKSSVPGSTTAQLKAHCDPLKIQAAVCSSKYNYTSFQFTVT